MPGRLALVSLLSMCTGCCASLCEATYASAIDNCDDWYPRDTKPERNDLCRSHAQASLDACQMQCDEAERTPTPSY